jgi:hypothetical protein
MQTRVFRTRATITVAIKSSRRIVATGAQFRSKNIRRHAETLLAARDFSCEVETMSAPVSSQTVLAYWLLPAPPAREFFRETIARLAAECDAPLFEPHLTFAVGPDGVTEAHRILAGPSAGLIELAAAGIHYTNKFTRTLFVQFESSAKLDRLRNSLGRVSRDPEPFLPHVSLLYKEMPGEKQAQFAATIQFPFKTVTFDAVQAMRCRVPVLTAADIAAWEVVSSFRLVP